MSEEGNTEEKLDYESDAQLAIIALQQLKIKLKDKEYASSEMFDRVQIYRGFRPNSKSLDPQLKNDSSPYGVKSLTEWRALVTMFLEDEGDECVDAYLRMSNHQGDINDIYQDD